MDALVHESKLKEIKGKLMEINEFGSVLINFSM
jgi:hypothetical protein